MLRGKGYIDVIGKLGDVVTPPSPTILRPPLTDVPEVETRPEAGGEASGPEPGDDDVSGEGASDDGERPPARENDDDDNGDGAVGQEDKLIEPATFGADTLQPVNNAGDVPEPMATVPTSQGEQSSFGMGQTAGAVLAPTAPVQPVIPSLADPVETSEPAPAAPNDPIVTLAIDPVVVSLDPVAAPVVEAGDMLEPMPAADPFVMPEIDLEPAVEAETDTAPDISPVEIPKIDPIDIPVVAPVAAPEDEDEKTADGGEGRPADDNASVDVTGKDSSEFRYDGEMPDLPDFGGGMPAMHHQAGGKFGWFCGFEDEDDLQIIIGGDADAVGEHTFADGKITGMIEDKGFVTVGRAQAVFEASADDGDGGFAFATAETFAEVTGADFVFTFTREWHGDEEGGFSSTAADKSITTVYAIDFEYWSPRHTIEINTTFGTGEFEPDILPDGNIATFEADLLALGDDTFVELFSDAFAVEDQFSTVSGVATLIG